MPLGKSVVFLGTGNMAEALLKGLLREGTADPEEIVCAEPRQERREEIANRYGVEVTGDNRAAVAEADLVILSVKPQVVEAVLAEISPPSTPASSWCRSPPASPSPPWRGACPAGTRIIRTMPNTPALVGAGATAITRGPHATEADLTVARALFEAVGTVVVVEEPLLDGVTGLSGSRARLRVRGHRGPGRRRGEGGPPPAGRAGAGRPDGDGRGPAGARDGPTPGRAQGHGDEPGGTTIAGVQALEARGFRAALMEAVEAATRRARELGEKSARKE